MKVFNPDNLVRDNIKKLKPYASARDEFKNTSTDMVFIDANENPFNSKLNRYPDPRQSLVKQELAKLKNVSSSQILLGNGSDEILDLIFRVFCQPNKDAVIILPPTYGMYRVLANTNDIQLIEVNLLSNFQPDVDTILDAQNERTKLLFLCSPNNPTANSFHAQKIEKLIKKFNGIVIIDEAYIDFSLQESWITRLNEFPNLIVTQTLSKAYGLAGIRLGICYASKEIIAVLHKIKPPYNVNTLTQDVALKALQNQEKIKTDIACILDQRETLAERLSTALCVEQVYPSSANFLLVKVDNATKRYHQLIKKGIVVRNRTHEVLCENCLRFTVGTPKENELLIQTLNNL